MLGAYGTPILGERGGLRGSAMAPLERAMVASYRLSIVTVALSVTIWPQFAIECFRRLNQQGVGDFGPKFRAVPLEQTRYVRVAKSEHPMLTNGEIIFEEFQPMRSQFSNVTEKTDCAVENEGSHVIGEFVDGRGVQFWNCRREGSCHVAKH